MKFFVERVHQSKVHFIVFLALSVSFLAAVQRKPNPQPDCGFVQNVYGQRISWKGNFPISLYIDPSVPKELRPAIYRAVTTWEKASGGQNLFKLIELKDAVALDSKSHVIGTAPAKDQKNVIYFLKNWDSNKVAEQARTSVYWVGDSIREADVRVNGKEFSFYIDDVNNILYSKLIVGLPEMVKGSFVTNVSAFVSKDLENSETPYVERLELSSQDKGQYQFRAPLVGYNFEALMLHELGHFLGLRHRDEGKSVMATYLAAQTDRIHLDRVDVENLACEYAQTKTRLN